MKITIVTVCFNAVATIEATIRSVAEQDWDDVEHLIIDGGSKDGTQALVERLAHDRLTFVSEADKGMYDAMNKGLARATGTYTGFLNADDFLAGPGALRAIAECAIATDADCIMGDTRFVDADGQPKGRFYSTAGFGRWWLRIGLMPPHPSFYARTDLMRRIGGYDLRYRISSDFDLIARLMLVHRASWARVGATIACFRVGGISTAGIESKRRITRDITESLRAIGQPFPALTAQIRFVPKLMQLAAGWLVRRRAPG